MKSQIKIFLLIGLLGVISLPGQAQRPHRKKNKEVKEYIKNNILPVAVQYRNSFESELSSNERSTIDALRARKEALRANRKANRRDIQGVEGVRSVPTDEERKEMKAAHKEGRLIKTAAYEIVDNHEDFFERMESELANEMKKWRSDIKGLIEKNRENSFKEERRESRKGRHGMRRPHRVGRLLTPVAFVMMDPENPLFGHENQLETQIFPNPAADSQTVSIDMKQAGKVTIELVDPTGKAQGILFSGNLEAGSQEVKVDLSGLDQQQYLYKISTPSGTEVKRVLLKN